MANVLQEVFVRKVAKSAHVYRQVLATLAISLLSLGGGVTCGFSAVLLPQLQNDPNFPYDESFDSWIASMSPLAMIVGSIFSGSMSDGIGRRMGMLVLIVPFALGWIIMGLANNNTVMLIGRFITGVCGGGMRANSMIYIAECIDPNFRAIAFFYPCVTAFVGILISHIVGNLHWKTSCFIFSLPFITAFIMLMSLKESPLWLLSKGRIDVGIESFREFRGNGENAEKELTTVLEKTKAKAGKKTTFRDTLDTLFSKPFMKSVAIAFLLLVATQWSGITTLPFYAQTIFETTFSGNIDSFMFMVVSDSVRIVTIVFVCIFSKFLPRRTTYLICCLSTGLSLVGLVIYLYLAPAGLVGIAVACMVTYIAMAIAAVSISWTFIAEIFPSELRGFGCGLSSAISFVLLFISVKVTPEVMNKLGDTVMYAIFAGISLFTGILLSFILPETNGRSLQDIENSMYKKKDSVKRDNEAIDHKYVSEVKC